MIRPDAGRYFDRDREQVAGKIRLQKRTGNPASYSDGWKWRARFMTSGRRSDINFVWRFADDEPEGRNGPGKPERYE